MRDQVRSTRYATPSRVREGRPFPQGASFDGQGTNFALFSAHATKVELCLFDDQGNEQRIELPEYTNEIWHGYLPEVKPGQRYGYRVHGPYAPAEGHRFNHHKLLLDPYAREIDGDLTWADELYGYTIGHPDGDLSFDERDSAAFMPKAVVVEDTYDWEGDERLLTPWNRTFVYETHVRGYTQRHPRVPDDLKGTCAGLAQKDVLDYIKGLGVTAVELLPVHAYLDDQHLLEKGLRNYWGYNSLAFFAPKSRYLASGHRDEFRDMVKAMHAKGLEVFMDVVYNHTAEGNELGPTLSFKGIDNASYYRLAEDKRYYINDTGTGNTFNLSNLQAIRFVCDSLRYWAQEMHVDGFRFDLATILGREPYGFDEGGGFLDSCRQDPVLSRVKLLAEPWDCGPGGYQVGGFPPGWAEWNDRYLLPHVAEACVDAGGTPEDRGWILDVDAYHRVVETLRSASFGDGLRERNQVWSRVDPTHHTPRGTLHIRPFETGGKAYVDVKSHPYEETMVRRLDVVCPALGGKWNPMKRCWAVHAHQQTALLRAMEPDEAPRERGQDEYGVPDRTFRESGLEYASVFGNKPDLDWYEANGQIILVDTPEGRVEIVRVDPEVWIARKPNKGNPGINATITEACGTMLGSQGNWHPPFAGRRFRASRAGEVIARLKEGLPKDDTEGDFPHGLF